MNTKHKELIQTSQRLAECLGVMGVEATHELTVIKYQGIQEKALEVDKYSNQSISTMYRNNEDVDFEDNECSVELLHYHNTVQEIEIACSDHWFDVFIDQNYPIKLEWLYEV